ncbi:MAG: polyprenyl synthetase family protein [Gammaproteobacteria bacterium]|nr:polyprenyl synthetase family protein [Gammaproteobacteria bacterium]
MTTDLPTLRETIEDALRHYQPEQSATSQPLIDAMRYASLSGGKRIRPMLVCATCTGLGGSLADALAPACAIEYIHAYSLIHDDLPSMDDDELRHGLPSTHIKFGEATAILAGDGLHSLAFETLANAPNIAPALRLRAVQLLSHAIGWEGMVGGQSFDLEATGKSLSLSELQALHAAKTGALIKVAVQIGAVLAGVEQTKPETFVLLSEFADRLGLAFQMIDDILDVTQSTEVLGKPAGSDSKAGKSTFPELLGLEPAQEMAEALLAEALPMLSRIGLQHNQLADLAQLSIKREF